MIHINEVPQKGSIFMVRRNTWLVTFLCVALCAAVLIPTIYAPSVADHSSSSGVSSQPLMTPSSQLLTTASSQPLSTINRLVGPIGGTVNSIQPASPMRPSAKLPAAFLKLQKQYQLVPIPTYDGSYQLTHPKVLYFPQKWNGYQYWMSMTPYPHEHDIYENPSIVVSNDGKNWVVPKGVTNPVTGLPPDVKAGGHYSDPHLVMNGNKMELWYRYNPSLPNKKKFRLPNNSINIYYRISTADGIHWSKPEKLLESNDGHLSLCVNYENGIYETWYATYDGQLCHSQSKNAHDWDAPVTCTVPLPKGYQPYHQDLIRYGKEYFLLQTAEKASNYTFALFLLASEDGIHFRNVQQIYPNGDMKLWKDVSFYRSTLFVKDNKLNLYISMIIPKLKWYMTQITLPIPDTTPADNKLEQSLTKFNPVSY